MMPLSEVRRWCASQGVTENRLVMRAYKRGDQGMVQTRWLEPSSREAQYIDGMTFQEVADWINEKIDDEGEGIKPNDVRINRRDQLVSNPDRTDHWLLQFMLIALYAKKWKPTNEMLDRFYL